MPKLGDVKYIDDVKHTYSAGGNWVPENKSDDAQQAIINAGKSLWQMIKGKQQPQPQAVASEPVVPRANTLGGKINFPQ